MQLGSVPPVSAAMKADNPRRTSQAKIFTLAAMSLGFGVVQLDVTIVNTALGSIGTAFGGDVSTLQWVVNTYTIGFAALILTTGALGDRIGAKRVFMAGFALFTAASLACALSPNIGLLIAARAVQGIAAAVLVPNSLALLNHAYHDEAERGRAVGLWAAGASIALTAGPLAGGALTALTGWRAIFLVNLPIGLAGLWLTWRYVRETPRAVGRALDLPGQAAAILALGALAGAMIEGGKRGWTNPWILSGIAAAIVFALLFVLREQRARLPMLPLALFRHRMFSLTALVGLLTNIAFYGLIFMLSLYFQNQNHMTPLQTGLAFLPMMGVVLPANLLAPRLAERIGAPAVIAIGAVIAAVGALALLFVGRGTSYWMMVAQLLALGGGLGLMVPPLTSALLGSVGRAQSGIASGVLNSARQSGSVLGVALFGSLIAGEFISGLKTSLIISAALLLGSAAIIAIGGRTAGARR
jgi:DHA2 family methylenomycin A resistance protein-like MFS transporter